LNLHIRLKHKHENRDGKTKKQAKKVGPVCAPCREQLSCKCVNCSLGQ
jgi:hypothetical protein